jgi:hypothetical protein
MKVEFSQKTSQWIAVALLAVMAALMLAVARNDSATVDETTFLSAGYTYLTGHRYHFEPEHPPLSQMLPAIPLLFVDIKYSDNARALLEDRAGYPWTRPWFGPVRAWQDYFPNGRNNWYFWALPEAQLFGQMFVYDGNNDGDGIMFAGRCVQILLTLAVGALIFFWVRLATANEFAALCALALWVFNPNALAHGHLITTDIGITLAMPAAIFLFARFLESPTNRNMALCGAVTGVALMMKFTAITLAPMYVVLTALSWKKLRAANVNIAKMTAIGFAATWAVVLLVNFPRWLPAPPMSEAQANALGVPGWFQGFRPLLIPPDFFKGLALTLGHSKTGHEGYLLGEWSQQGWWYYYPVVLFLKSPLAFSALLVTAAVVFLKNRARARPLEWAAWASAALFLLAAMTSKVNIGVRHLLPMFPLFIVGIGCAIPRLKQWLAGGLVAWQAVICLLCAPLYLQFFSEAVGGANNGYKYLIDSNYDWGQDAKRLKAFLDERHIGQIYLDYFGTQYSIEYLKIPNTRIDAEKARQIVQGWLVISASQLMRPEWSWLRETRQPTARVADTLFVYQFP